MGRGARSGAAVLLAAATALVAVAAPAVATEVDLGAFSGPVRFVAPDGTTLDLGDRRYIGTIEGAVGPDGGLTVVDELSFDGYLEGLAEVPVSWPEQTLQAQVIAARTYAWRSLRRGQWEDEGFDICATQACQVFAGRDLAEADPAGRWAAAVAATSGRVLLDATGEPILARYSSSNGGRSRANHEVFPVDGEFPYLQPVDDPFDEASPFHTWQVTFPREDLDRILARGETLSAAVPLADVTLVEVPDDEDLVRVTGRDGTVAEVTASEFRFFVAATAPDVAPDRYPTVRVDDPSRRYPATLLSSQLAFTVTDDVVVVDGRGFGHAVGMSQYGALGRAEAGQSAEEILAAYYGGITPTTPDALPERVRVGIVQGGDELTLTPSGPVTVAVGDTVLTERGLGTWQVAIRDDRTVQLLAPEGYGAPLVVDPTATSRARPLPIEVVTLETVVNKHVELEVEVLDAGGAVVGVAPAGIAAPGRTTVDWSLATADGPLPAGSYGVRLVAIDEEGSRAGTPTPVEVVAVAAGDVRTALPVTAPPAPSTTPWWLVAAVLLGGAVVGVAAGTLLVRRPTRQEQP